MSDDEAGDSYYVERESNRMKRLIRHHHNLGCTGFDRPRASGPICSESDLDQLDL